MSAGRSFLDSNVLVYMDDARSPRKQQDAARLVEKLHANGEGVVSVQVLQEYFSVTTRKLGVDATIARRRVELFGEMHLVTPALDDILAAIDLHRLHQISFWDALIVRAAQHGGCATLYSEDLQSGRRFSGLEIVNPFA